MQCYCTTATIAAVTRLREGSFLWDQHKREDRRESEKQVKEGPWLELAGQQAELTQAAGLGPHWLPLCVSFHFSPSSA